MAANRKLARIVSERAIHDILGPQRFVKKGMNWRRNTGEVIQQLSIASMYLDGKHQPVWGLNIVEFDDNPEPLSHKLQVSWLLAETLGDAKTTDRIYKAYDFASSYSESKRRAEIIRHLEVQIVPCFEAFQTKESVREMSRRYDCPRRANQFIGLPDDWWPPE